MKTFLLLPILLFSLLMSSAQLDSTNCSLRGTITDKQSGEKLPFVTVKVLLNNKVIHGAYSDFDGNYCIKNLPSNTYTLEVNFVGYKKNQINKLTLKKDSTSIVNIQLSTDNVQLSEVVVISKQNLVSHAPVRSAASLSATVNRDYRRRTSSYYVDGIKIPNTESYESIKENKFLAVNKEPLSTFSIDVDKASYSNIRRFINQGTLPPKDAVRIEEMINYFDYDYPESTNEHPFSIQTEYTECPWNKKHRLASIAIQGNKIDWKKAPSNNLVFLIDVSGSMGSSNKLGLLKAGLSLLVDQLRKKDKVSIVVYAGAAGVVLKPTSGAKKKEIKEAINRLHSGGSTAGGEGINLAYKMAKKSFLRRGNNRVILATDGDFNVGISGDDELIKLIEEKRKDNIFLSVLGFGTGNYKDSKMEKIADKGNGNYAYIDNILEAKKVLVKEMGGTLITLAKDVKLQIEFNPIHVRSYRLIGYENRKLNNEDFDDDKKDAGELGSGHTVTALYEIVPATLEDTTLTTNTLKYQASPLVNKHVNSSEILTVKFRYKHPKEEKSLLITQAVPATFTPFEQATDNLKFASAVIEFGMLLRQSDYLGEASFDQAIKIAKKAKGKDKEGYRAEFIKLVETAELLQQTSEEGN